MTTHKLGKSTVNAINCTHYNYAFAVFKGIEIVLFNFAAADIILTLEDIIY